jgi:hypothetical protein
MKRDYDDDAPRSQSTPTAPPPQPPDVFPRLVEHSAPIQPALEYQLHPPKRKRGYLLRWLYSFLPDSSSGLLLPQSNRPFLGQEPQMPSPLHRLESRHVLTHRHIPRLRQLRLDHHHRTLLRGICDLVCSSGRVAQLLRDSLCVGPNLARDTSLMPPEGSTNSPKARAFRFER